MKNKVFLRPALSIVFGFIGILVARGGTPPDIMAAVGDYFLFIAFLAFATFGFILPDIVVLAGNAGINALARQIAEIIDSRPRSINVPSIRFRRVKKEKKYLSPIVIDTSVLIDGRVLQLVQLGFLSGTILIIPSVIGELHKLSDSADENKRSRGRRGLDFISLLMKSKKIKVEVLKNEPKVSEVDYKIVELAKKIKARLMTVDFNLNKVAKIKGVEVLNINDLANGLKLQIIPKDEIMIKISAIGKEKGQGVGYLEDGTMVVVDGGEEFVGKTTKVLVERVFTSSAGKMIFAKIG